MIKRLLLLTLLIPLLTVLCGCGYPPTERQTFPICMTVDITKEGKTQVGIQAPENTQSGDGGQSYAILAATGDTLQDALYILEASTPYPLNFCQLRLLMISYELASTTEMRGFLRQLAELPTMRPNAFVMVALGSALEVMNAQKPDFGMRLSTHLNLLFERLRDEDMLPDSTLASCVRELGEKRSDPIICICAVNPQLLPEDQKKSGEGQQGGGGSESGGGGSGGSGGEAAAFALGEPWNNKLLPDQLIAGMLPHSSSNPVEYLGAAVISDDRISGLLTAREAQVVLRAKDESTLRVAAEGDSMQLQVWIKKGTPLHKESGVLLNVMKKLQALDSDALGFGGASTASFYEDAAWEAFDFHGKYSGADIVICVE